MCRLFVVIVVIYNHCRRRRQTKPEQINNNIQTTTPNELRAENWQNTICECICGAKWKKRQTATERENEKKFLAYISGVRAIMMKCQYVIWFGTSCVLSQHSNDIENEANEMKMKRRKKTDDKLDDIEIEAARHVCGSWLDIKFHSLLALVAKWS